MTLSLQLYSMRDCADQVDLLSHLPAMGITKVEGFGGVYGDPAGYRRAMDANGISMPSGHIALKTMEDDFEGAMQLATTMGMSRVFAPYLEESDRPRTKEGYQELARRLNFVAGKCAERGVTFGWHNHDFEFFALADGGIPMDILFETAPDLAWEGDLAWIVRGGRDPLDYIERFGDRLAAVHVKDIARDGANEDEDGWCDLGEGTLDWASYLRACRKVSDDLIYALEHDKPSDPVGYARKSAVAFNTLWEASDD